MKPKQTFYLGRTWQSWLVGLAFCAWLGYGFKWVQESWHWLPVYLAVWLATPRDLTFRERK